MKSLTTLMIALFILILAGTCLASPDSVELVDGNRVIIRCNGTGSVADDEDFDVLGYLQTNYPTNYPAGSTLRILMVAYVSDTPGTDVLVLETADDDWIEPPFTLQNAGQPMRGEKLPREVSSLYIDEMSAGGICIIYLH